MSAAAHVHPQRLAGAGAGRREDGRRQRLAVDYGNTATTHDFTIFYFDFRRLRYLLKLRDHVLKLLV